MAGVLAKTHTTNRSIMSMRPPQQGQGCVRHGGAVAPAGSAGYCQVDAEWTKLAGAEPSDLSKLLHEGNTGRIAPSGEGVLTRSSVLIGRQAMTAELEVVVDRAVG
jgi:hypothetical protein